MTTHHDCKHEPTKAGRARCRMIRKWLEQAEDLGLLVNEHPVESDHIRQWSISQKDHQGTWLLITSGDAITTVSRHFRFLDVDEKLAHKEVKFWITAIGWERDDNA